MANVKQFNNNPRDFALELVEEGMISMETLAVSLIKYMSHDDVRGALEANELSPDHMYVICDSCDHEFKGMDGEFNDDGYTFTCEDCIAERDDDDDDDDDDNEDDD
jgi:hypothetical protein